LVALWFGIYSKGGINMENKLIHLCALNLANRLNQYMGKSGPEFTKLVLGMEVIIINVSKLIIIYLLAAALGVVVQTAIIQAGYVLIKRHSFGLHALNSTVCTVVSCLMFVITPLILSGFGINNLTVLVVFIFIVMCLYLYAPADTKARPLVGVKLRAHLKKKAVFCGLVLMLITLLIPSYELKFLLTLGAVYQCLGILPITYKILKRSEKNYEKFEQT